MADSFRARREVVLERQYKAHFERKRAYVSLDKVEEAKIAVKSGMTIGKAAEKYGLKTTTLHRRMKNPNTNATTGKWFKFL